MISNTRLRTWRTCPQKEYLSFDLGLEPTTKPERLAWGSAFHAGRAGLAYEADPFVRASVEKVLAVYREPCEVVAAELHFELPFHGGTLCGDIDAIGTINGRLVIVERKTTSRPVEDLLQNLDLDTQVLTYWLGARHLGYDVQSVLYCVQPKPTERPKKATPVEKRKYKKGHLNESDVYIPGPLYANQRTTDETPDEYAARIEVDPPTFKEVPVLHDALARHERETQAQIRLREFQRANALIYRNPQACEDCWFTEICLRSDLTTTVPDGFIRRTAMGSVQTPTLASS